MKTKLKLVWKYAKHHKGKFMVLFMCIMITTFTGQVFPYIFGRMVDEVFYEKNMSVFLNIVIIYAVLYFFNQIMHFILNITWAKLMTRFLFDIRRDLFNKVLSYKGKTLLGIYTGDIINRINKDTDQFMNLIHWNIFYTTSNIISLILAITYMAYISLPLAVLAIIMTPISVYVSRYFAKKVKGFYTKISKQSGILSSWLFEIIKGMQDIKLLSATKKILYDYVGKTVKISRLQIEANKVEVISERVNEGISLSAQLLLYSISAVLIYNNQLTVGGFVSCVSYFGTCVGAFKGFNSKISNLAGNMVGIERIEKLLDEDSEDYNTYKKDIKIEQGNVTLDHVSFSYNKDVAVLNGVTLTVYEGEKVALVGKSGSGKSTIVNLIYKLYEADGGDITIDGININDFNLHNLRSQIGIVHQETALFEGTIRYNLTFNNNKDKDQPIWGALEMAHLSEFVKSLPDGLDTVLGTGKYAFSGGQKQRLAIARIFVKNPKILIFDEATSALDSEAESVIKQSWDKLCIGRTIFIIAHRLSTIISSDRVAVLHEGSVVGYGNHKDLLDNCEEYRRLFKEQYSLGKEVALFAQV